MYVWGALVLHYMLFYTCIQRVPDSDCREDSNHTDWLWWFSSVHPGKQWHCLNKATSTSSTSFPSSSFTSHPTAQHCISFSFPINTLYVFLFQPKSATDLAHIILFDLIILNVRWGEQIIIFTIMQFPRLQLCLLQIQWYNDTYLSSQMTAFRSRWFVGSSNNRRVGSRNKALARDTLIRQPPEKFLVARFCISLENPKPARIRRARGSAESALIAFSSS